MDAECMVEGRKLALNGTGFRKLFMVNVYQAWLFTHARVTSEHDLYAFTDPIRIAFKYLYGPIHKGRIVDAWARAFEKNRVQNCDAAIDAFLATMTDYQREDVVHYDLLPSAELRVYQNSKLNAAIPSRPLCEAILDVVFGPVPIDAKLKEGLLNRAGQPTGTAE